MAKTTKKVKTLLGMGGQGKRMSSILPLKDAALIMVGMLQMTDAELEEWINRNDLPQFVRASATTLHNGEIWEYAKVLSLCQAIACRMEKQDTPW